MRAERLRISTTGSPSKPQAATSVTRESSNGTRKRKAPDEDEDSRKKTKPVLSFSDRLEANENEAKTSLPHKTVASAATPTQILTTPSQTPQQIPPDQSIDEEEWAAFERDIATPLLPSFSHTAPSDLMAAATISAAPLLAADIAAQERQDERLEGKELRYAELEAEKEDAARALEEEFDEMEGLEERVRRLRDRREALRMARKEDGKKEEEAERMGDGVGATGEEGNTDGGSDGASEDERFDEWGFRP